MDTIISAPAMVDELDFLPSADARLLNQLQGRSCAHLFGLIERFIGAQTLAAGARDKCTWAVLGLACYFGALTQEESQRAAIDELQWLREDRKLDAGHRNAAVDDLIELLMILDEIVQAQAGADADHFVAMATSAFSSQQVGQIRALLCKAYRWQYVACGVVEPRFQALLGSLVSDAQMQHIHNALTPLLGGQPLQASAQRQQQLVVIDRLVQHCA